MQREGNCILRLWWFGDIRTVPKLVKLQIKE